MALFRIVTAYPDDADFLTMDQIDLLDRHE
jgi:hypothetical protein